MEAESNQSEESASANGAQKSSNEPKETKNPEVEESRRVRSREAAKSRRDQESIEIFNLSQLLPVPSHVIDSLDKSTILRLAFSVLRVGAFLGKSTFSKPNEPQSPQEGSEASDNVQPGKKPISKFTQSSGLLSAMGAFLMVISSDGCISYCSPNVRTLLGICDVEVMGNKIMDFVDPDDLHIITPHLKRLHQDGVNQVGDAGVNWKDWHKPDPSIADAVAAPGSCSFAVHMKCSNEKKNSNKTASSHASMVASNKSHSYELVRCRGQYCPPGMDLNMAIDTTLSLHSMVILCKPVVTSSSGSMESLTNCMAFRTRHNLDFNIVECYDNKQEVFTGYPSTFLIGQSLYHLIHPEDAKQLEQKHRTLVNDGDEDSITMYLRYMLPNSNNLWVQMVANLARSGKTSRPMYITATNFVVGNVKQDQWHNLSTELSNHQALAAGTQSSSSLASNADESESPAQVGGATLDLSRALVGSSENLALPESHPRATISHLSRVPSEQQLHAVHTQQQQQRPSEFRSLLESNPGNPGDLVYQSYLSSTNAATDSELDRQSDANPPAAKRPRKESNASSLGHLHTSLRSSLNVNSGDLVSPDSVFSPEVFSELSSQAQASLLALARPASMTVQSPMLPSPVGAARPVLVAQSPRESNVTGLSFAQAMPRPPAAAAEAAAAAFNAALARQLQTPAAAATISTMATCISAPSAAATAGTVGSAGAGLLSSPHFSRSMLVPAPAMSTHLIPSPIAVAGLTTDAILASGIPTSATSGSSLPGAAESGTFTHLLSSLERPHEDWQSDM
ncbi:single-minded homolog 2-like [Sycon ciliatum]|uniref:single-minded homolog 2-like n=1 Tax=Sycon ciliatum TaxID=27933 RepID=UPI0031F688DD